MGGGLGRSRTRPPCPDWRCPSRRATHTIFISRRTGHHVPPVAWAVSPPCSHLQKQLHVKKTPPSPDCDPRIPGYNPGVPLNQFLSSRSGSTVFSQGLSVPAPPLCQREKHDLTRRSPFRTLSTGESQAQAGCGGSDPGSSLCSVTSVR